MALQQDREERDRQSRIATEAAVAAALSNQTSQVQALRRPDLPPFDKTNIDAWIRRVEFAFARSSVNSALNKFAFVEKLFNSRDDAKVNSFLNGPQTDIKWTAFLDYLRDKYGRTRQQEVQSLLNGPSRDGRRPTELAAYITEQAGKVTIDDIKKEVLLKAMPAQVRLQLASKLDDLNFDETAEACDKYFDKSGKLKEQPNTSSINNIGVLKQPQQTATTTATSFTAPFPEDDATEVNAVRFRQGQRQSFDVSNHSSTRNRSSSNLGNRGGYSNGDSQRSRSSSRFGVSASNDSYNSKGPSSNPPNKHVCRIHVKYGEQAERCEGSWCLLKGKIAPKGQASR